MDSSQDNHLSERVRAFEEQLWAAIQQLAVKLDQIVQEQRDQGVTFKADFVKNIKQSQPPMLHTLLYTVFDHVAVGDTAATQDLVIKAIRKMCNSPKGLESARNMLGGIRFTERLTSAT
jgi:hypothetical protein